MQPTQPRTPPPSWVEVMTLREIYIADLNHLLEAARQKLMEWPILAARTKSPLLRETFDGHYAQTRSHLAALEGLFERLDERPRPLRANAFSTVLDWWRNRQRDVSSGDAQELALISTGLAVDYHTLPIYVDALTAARGLGDTDGSRTLQTLMNAERDRAHKLLVFYDWLASRLGGSGGKVDRWTVVETDLQSALAPSAATRRE
jgi:ferritin-like metal-binding protein YciE